MTLEMQDLIWLLLPVAFMSGWYVARSDQRRPPATHLPPDYFRGVNYLLNEQPDKAIEIFTRMLEINAETVETHLALGSLFRRRGEVERAIRIHQNLITRQNLDYAQRSEAVNELAQDYLKAGLLDRAETLFLELAEAPVHAEQALRSLMSIYEQEKDWDKAIAAGQRLAKITEQKLDTVLAQYHCELGDEALHANDPKLASDRATQALLIDGQCVRANVLLGQAAAARGDEHAAIAAWQKVEAQDPRFLDEVIGDISAAFRRLQQESRLRMYLQEVVSRHSGMRAMLILAELIRNEDGQESARNIIAAHLRQKPSVWGLKRFMDLQASLDVNALTENFTLIQSVLARLAVEQEGYQCRQCGYYGQALHWQCPACHGWSTILTATPTWIASQKEKNTPSGHTGPVPIAGPLS